MAVETAATCWGCANYSIRGSKCLEWREPVAPSDICLRFLACDGTGRLAEDETAIMPIGDGTMYGKVADLIAAGYSQKEVAGMLGIRASTVSCHVQRALEKGLLRRVAYGVYEGRPEW